MVYKEIALFADRVLMIDVPYSVCTLACSKRSDSGERCEVKKAMKSRGGLEREVPSLTALLHFFALLFTSYRSPLSERQELAICTRSLVL